MLTYICLSFILTPILARGFFVSTENKKPRF